MAVDCQQSLVACHECVTDITLVTCKLTDINIIF
jgi:hypothetical protein